MNQGFLFRIAPGDPQLLLGQVSRALEKRTELYSRKVCPGLWRITDKLNSFNRTAPNIPSIFYILSSLILTVLGLLLFTTLLVDPEGFLSLGLVGIAAYLWGLSRMYRIRRWTVYPILLLHGLAAVVTGPYMNSLDSGSGTMLLCTGVAELAAVPVLFLLSRRKKKESAFQQAASKLVELRSQLPVAPGMTVHFGPDGMDINGEAFVPYEQFEGIFVTKDLLLCICDDQAIILQKSELIEGDPAALESFLAQYVSLTQV